MKIDRRRFLGLAGTLAGGAVIGNPQKARATRKPKTPPDPYGCIVDLTACVGCRACELACNQINHLPPPHRRFDDLRVLNQNRRPHAGAFTVVNRYHAGKRDERNSLVPTFVKVQCMHCQDPGCVSACIVGALTKKNNGATHYDASKCIGCRYCMVACPFQLPAYEYHDPLFPRVQKCTFCYERISQEGGTPGCAAICPVEAITFGKRRRLLDVAHQKIKNDPGRYLNQIYGEHEVGGTSWLYMSGVPFGKLGFLNLPTQPIPHLTETIQHGLFAYLWAPLSLFAVLGGFMWIFNRKQIAADLEIHRCYFKHDTSRISSWGDSVSDPKEKRR
ncbi:MAG: 4Fe-4S dicluster domain-containing protein [Desulfobacterales bacterium]